MEHNEVEILLAEYASGRTTESENVGIEGHLLECQHCRILLDEFRSTFQLLEKYPRLPLSPSYSHSLLRKVRNAIDARHQTAWYERPGIERLVLPGAALALAVLLLVVAPIVPSFDGPTINHDNEALGSLRQDELLDGLADHSAQSPVNGLEGSRSVTDVVPLQLLDRELAETLLAADESVLVETAEDAVKLLNDFESAELKAFLERLSERSLL